MCAPQVTRHTSIRYSSSCHTRVNIGMLIFFTAAVIRAFRSARSRRNCGTNTRSLTYPQRKRSQAVMSGDLGGHSISCWSFPDASPIQRSGNTVFSYWRTSQWKRAGLPSCWNMNFSMFCNCGISHSCNLSRYVMPVTVFFCNTRAHYTACWFFLDVSSDIIQDAKDSPRTLYILIIRGSFPVRVYNRFTCQV
jgi:hypothetical protein